MQLPWKKTPMEIDNDFLPRWRNCPRCGERAYEKLKTHSHCVECFYSPALDGAIRISRAKETKATRRIPSRFQTVQFLED